MRPFIQDRQEVELVIASTYLMDTMNFGISDVLSGLLGMKKAIASPLLGSAAAKSQRENCLLLVKEPACQRPLMTLSCLLDVAIKPAVSLTF